MKKYIRWIIFGLIAVVLIILLVLVGINEKLREKVSSLLLEKFIQNKVRDLRDRAEYVRAQADAGKIAAEEAEKIVRETNETVSKQKESLQSKYESKGMNADEISNRFNNLNI